MPEEYILYDIIKEREIARNMFTCNELCSNRDEWLWLELDIIFYFWREKIILVYLLNLK